jgi:thiol-disulfide isomerase/thioredoxin
METNILNNNCKSFSINDISLWIWILIVFVLLYLYFNYFRYSETFEQNKKIYLFYADWCPHCQHLKPEWEIFTKLIDSKNYEINAINNCENLQLCNDFNIKGFPTIVYANGVKWQELKSRKSDELYEEINALD